MADSKEYDNWWALPALLLWGVFFLAGLFPDQVYYALRELGYVTTQRALTNNPWIVTWTFAGYIAWFTSVRCYESGQTHAVAIAKGMQSLLVGITAFMPIELSLIGDYLRIPVPFFRHLILIVIFSKALAWFLLVLMISIYYLGGGLKVFQALPSIFPSAYRHDDATVPSEDAAAPVSSAPSPCEHQENPLNKDEI